MEKERDLAVIDGETGELTNLGINFLTIDPTLVGNNAVVVELGSKVKSRMLEKYKGTEDKTDRIAFLSVSPVVVKYHYFDGIGYVQCNGGACCEHDAVEAKVRYLFPIIQYNKVGNGKWKDSEFTYEIKVLSTSADLYDSIVENHIARQEEGKSLISADFNIKCTDASFQKMVLTPQPTSLWQKNSEIVEDIKEKWNEIQKNIASTIAKEISEEKLLKLLAGLETDEVDEDEVDEKPKPKKKEKYISEDDE